MFTIITISVWLYSIVVYRPESVTRRFYKWFFWCPLAAIALNAFAYSGGSRTPVGVGGFFILEALTSSLVAVVVSHLITSIKEEKLNWGAEYTKRKDTIEYTDKPNARYRLGAALVWVWTIVIYGVLPSMVSQKATDLIAEREQEIDRRDSTREDLSNLEMEGFRRYQKAESIEEIEDIRAELKSRRDSITNEVIEEETLYGEAVRSVGAKIGQETMRVKKGIMELREMDVLNTALNEHEYQFESTFRKIDEVRTALRKKEFLLDNIVEELQKELPGDPKQVSLSLYEGMQRRMDFELLEQLNSAYLGYLRNVESYLEFVEDTDPQVDAEGVYFTTDAEVDRFNELVESITNSTIWIVGVEQKIYESM